ncbi:MAG: flagellar basal-body MS-ring/collar protein FliF [Pseudomonadota bacterium]
MNALTTTAPATERFANPLQQLGGLMAQPAVRRSLPMILLIGLIAAAALAWGMLSTPPQKTLFSQLTDADKGAVSQALTQAGIESTIDDAGALSVADEDFHKARMLLASQDLPKATPGGYQILDNLPMGVSRAVEGERLRQARESELAKSIEEIDAVAEARIHLAIPEASVFVRDSAGPSASVMIKLNAGRSLGEAQVRSIVNLVASSVPGLKPEAVTIVDQAGGLLSKPGGGNGATANGDARIEFQGRVEEKVRTQLVQLLTPLVGAGNFSTEVQADINLDETSATRESFEKQGALRVEQGNWTGNQKDVGAPGGIPGSLSNTAPAGATVAAPGTAPLPAASASPSAETKQSDQFSRAYDLGKEVSVSRTAPGDIKRLSVAVLLRDPDKGRRTALEINQVTELVRAAVGFNPQRQDQVTVISRKFAGAADTASEGPAWYDNAWLPMVARNVTAIVIALLVLIMGVKPLAAALMKRSDNAASPNRLALAAGQPGPGGSTGSHQLDRLESANNYDDRVGIVRGFTKENPARAALAVRDMIKADSK